MALSSDCGHLLLYEVHFSFGMLSISYLHLSSSLFVSLLFLSLSSSLSSLLSSHCKYCGFFHCMKSLNVWFHQCSWSYDQGKDEKQVRAEQLLTLNFQTAFLLSIQMKMWVWTSILAAMLTPYAEPIKTSSCSIWWMLQLLALNRTGYSQLEDCRWLLLFILSRECSSSSFLNKMSDTSGVWFSITSWHHIVRRTSMPCWSSPVEGRRFQLVRHAVQVQGSVPSPSAYERQVTLAEHVRTASGVTTQLAAPYGMKIRVTVNREMMMMIKALLHHHQLLQDLLLIRCQKTAGFPVQKAGILRVQLRTMPSCWLKHAFCGFNSVWISGSTSDNFLDFCI